MMPQNDQDWLDALAGRKSGAGGSPDALEARALRDGILARVAEDVAGVPAIDEARESELLDRARREGLIPERSVHRAEKVRVPWWNAWRMSVAFGALATVVLVVGLLLRPGEPPRVVRGAHDAVIRIEAADPAALQREILSELRAAGIEAKGYEGLGTLGIDADLPVPIPPEVVRVLQSHDIRAPEDGILVLEIGERAR